MSSAVGDQSQLRQRKAYKEREAETRKEVVEEPGPMDIDAADQEYINYFREKYGDNPRTDIFGIDGAPLFCLIYIVLAGTIFTIIYLSLYVRHKDEFHNALHPATVASALSGTFGKATSGK